MSSTLTNKFRKLWASLRSQKARNDFVSSTIAARLAVRIFNLRKERGWTQPQLAERAQMKQARISLLEQGDYENFTFSTLKKIAAAFDVAVIVDLVSFPDFLKWSENLSAETALPDSFQQSDAQGIGISVPDALSGQLSRKTQDTLNNALQLALQNALAGQNQSRPRPVDLLAMAAAHDAAREPLLPAMIAGRTAVAYRVNDR